MIANTVYVNKDYTLNPKFVKLANDYYDATPESRNFKDGRTLDVINKWASDHTEKMVEKVLDTNSFDTDAVSYLLNAIYFKGVWANKFLKSETKDEEFEGVENKLPMMHQERELAYSENEDCQVVRLPYGNHAYTMTILLPRKGKTVEKVLEGLTCESWRQKYQYLGSALVDLKLPRFETKTDVGLNDIMKSLGMPLAFTDDAEFPYFCDVPTKIDMMKQVARIKLDEEGTEAAAVTVIGMVKATSVAPTEPRRVNFHATRPFLYVISEQSTGAIFFIGQYLGN
jgi:serpin B